MFRAARLKGRETAAATTPSAATKPRRHQLTRGAAEKGFALRPKAKPANATRQGASERTRTKVASFALMPQTSEPDTKTAAASADGTERKPTRNAAFMCWLTFDMSGKQRRAQCCRSGTTSPAVVCPLDGGVSRHCVRSARVGFVFHRAANHAASAAAGKPSQKAMM
jgi:hypothetical protein